MWRFLTLPDSHVDVMVFRDLDSQILKREITAVNEWLNSSYPMHVMRDHPHHGPVVLGQPSASLRK
jgi:hypothetical protein